MISANFVMFDAFVETERQQSINRSLCHDATQVGFGAATQFLLHMTPGGEGVLPYYLGYTGTCRWTGYGFFWSRCPKQGMQFDLPLP